jgi:hypothetical protein
VNLFYLVTILNLLGLSYLTFLFYRFRFKSHPQANSNLTPSQTNYKIHLNRFNPFEEVGGDQSFILCLLDNSLSGVIITSLHHRDFTRVYAKTIKNGESLQGRLSPEEIKALNETINN